MNIKSTDREDFRLIYEQNFELLMQVVIHIVYNIDIAEDLVQEAFERFYVRNMSFPSEDDARYWLLRVAKNLALNYVRRNKREGEMVEKGKPDPGIFLLAARLLGCAPERCAVLEDSFNGIRAAKGAVT